MDVVITFTYRLRAEIDGIRVPHTGMWEYKTKVLTVDRVSYQSLDEEDIYTMFEDGLLPEEKASINYAYTKYTIV